MSKRLPALLAAIALLTISLLAHHPDPTAYARAPTAPTVSTVAITSDPDDDVYGIGDIISVTVDFSEEVIIEDTP